MIKTSQRVASLPAALLLGVVFVKKKNGRLRVIVDTSVIKAPMRDRPGFGRI